ncbi:MAG: glutathione S-transferase family protein [Novosphingobium sp.]
MTGLRLHGYPVSNYVNIVRADLIEKDLAYELVITGAASTEPFLTMNPMGKIPVLEVQGFFLGETVAILEFLDDRYPVRTLRPDDVLVRARGRQIINVVQMYVEAPARSLFPGVFMGGVNSDDAVSSARKNLDRAVFALRRLAVPAPFLMGAGLSQADLFVFYNLDIADRLTRFVFDSSILEDAGLDQWHAMMATRPSTQAVLADFETFFVRYLSDKRAAYRAPQSGTPTHA